MLLPSVASHTVLVIVIVSRAAAVSGEGGMRDLVRAERNRVRDRDDDGQFERSAGRHRET